MRKVIPFRHNRFKKPRHFREKPAKGRRPRRSRWRTLALSWLPVIALGGAAAVYYGPAEIPGAIGGSSSTEAITGRASVIDGDTLTIHGQRIRLHGIDAPESGQSCTAGGKAYRCGQRATLVLSDKIGARPVSCEQRDVDRYKRIVAVCHAGGENLNAWLVSEGWALAYRRHSREYVREETAARLAGRGMWLGEFVEPWEWRRGKRQ